MFFLYLDFLKLKVRFIYVLHMMDLPGSLESVAIACFVSACDSPLAEILKKCKLYRENDGEDVVLVVDSPSKAIAKSLWLERKLLAAAAINLQVAQKAFIKYQGRLFRPPFNIQAEYSGVRHTMQQFPILSQCQLSDGDLIKRILDSGISAGLVDVETNQMIASSKQISSTSGRDWFFMQTAGRDMNSMWPPNSLHDLSRELRQQGHLRDRAYTAYTWVQEGGIWVRAERQFKAALFELVYFGDRLCRLSMGVEIV